MKDNSPLITRLEFCLIVFLVVFSLPAISQKSFFVRIYDSNGVKTQKGFVLSLTDTSLTLQNGSRNNTIQLKDIGLLKTKHSAGHDILVGSIVNSVFNAIIFSAFAKPQKFENWTVGNGILYGILTGSVSGALAGGLNALFKKSETFLIQGDLRKWQDFKKAWFANNILQKGLNK